MDKDLEKYGDELIGRNELMRALKGSNIPYDTEIDYVIRRQPAVCSRSDIEAVKQYVADIEEVHRSIVDIQVSCNNLLTSLRDYLSSM